MAPDSTVAHTLSSITLTIDNFISDRLDEANNFWVKPMEANFNDIVHKVENVR